MLGAAQADTFRAELGRDAAVQPGFSALVRTFMRGAYRPRPSACKIARPVPVDRLDQSGHGHRRWCHQGDDAALSELAIADPQGPRIHVDRQARSPRNTGWRPMPRGNHGGVLVMPPRGSGCPWPRASRGYPQGWFRRAPGSPPRRARRGLPRYGHRARSCRGAPGMPAVPLARMSRGHRDRSVGWSSCQALRGSTRRIAVARSISLGRPCRTAILSAAWRCASRCGSGSIHSLPRST